MQCPSTCLLGVVSAAGQQEEYPEARYRDNEAVPRYQQYQSQLLPPFDVRHPQDWNGHEEDVEAGDDVEAQRAKQAVRRRGRVAMHHVTSISFHELASGRLTPWVRIYLPVLVEWAAIDKGSKEVA